MSGLNWNEFAQPEWETDGKDKPDQQLRDDGNINRYFHVMLNMADDDLNPYQYRLLGHYRRVCGLSGACWESTRTTAKVCKMSTGKVSSTRKELVEAGYIKLEYREDDTCLITVIDRMPENVTRYTKRSPDEQGVHGMNVGVHHMKQRRTSEEKPKEEEKKKDIAPKKRTAKKPSLELPELKAVHHFKANYQGRLNQLLLEKLVDTIRAYGDQAVFDAITTAVMGSSKGLNLNYVIGILKGKARDNQKSGQPSAAPRPMPIPVASREYPPGTEMATEEQRAHARQLMQQLTDKFGGKIPS